VGDTRFELVTSTLSR